MLLWTNTTQLFCIYCCKTLAKLAGCYTGITLLLFLTIKMCTFYRLLSNYSKDFELSASEEEKIRRNCEAVSAVTLTHSSPVHSPALW